MAAGAGCVALGLAGLAMILSGAGPTAYALLPFIFAAVFGAGLVAETSFDSSLYRRQRESDVRRIEAQARLFQAEVESKVAELRRPAGGVAHPEPPALAPRAAAWRAYWIEQLVYASEHGGLAWQQMRGVYPRLDDWRDHLALPLIRRGWVNPIQQGVPTGPAQDMTLGRMILAMMDGDLPPLPDWSPPRSANEAKQSTA